MDEKTFLRKSDKKKRRGGELKGGYYKQKNLYISKGKGAGSRMLCACSLLLPDYIMCVRHRDGGLSVIRNPGRRQVKETFMSHVRNFILQELGFEQGRDTVSLHS